MTPEQAAALARSLYPSHAEAAAALILAATEKEPSEIRERAAKALRVLDPDEPLGSLYDGPAWTAALSIATLLVGSVSGVRPDRQRVAGLLRALCGEAARIHENERAA
jgi:hypothetical protein